MYFGLLWNYIVANVTYPITFMSHSGTKFYSQKPEKQLLQEERQLRGEEQPEPTYYLIDRRSEVKRREAGEQWSDTRRRSALPVIDLIQELHSFNSYFVLW